MGIIFAQISVADFRVKCTVWGIIGGIYIQAIKIPDRAHKTPPDGIRGGKTADRATATKAGHARSDNGAGHRHRLPGRPAALPPGRAAPDRQQAGRDRLTMCARRRPAAPLQQPAGASPRTRSATGRRPYRQTAGQQDGRTADQTPTPARQQAITSQPPPQANQTPAPAIPNAHARARAHPREILNAPARRYWRRQRQALRVRKRKFFLGEGAKNRFPGAGRKKEAGAKMRQTAS